MVSDNASAYLVQIVLPVYDNSGDPIPQAQIKKVSHELTRRFGGATSYLRAPAEGLWKKSSGVDRDQVVIVETMVEHLDRGWWGDYRLRLEERFEQEEILIRSQMILKL